MCPRRRPWSTGDILKRDRSTRPLIRRNANRSGRPALPRTDGCSGALIRPSLTTQRSAEAMMFVGHYAAALAAKAAQPKAPFWTYVLGAQIVDVAWAALVLSGVEKMSLDPHLPGNPLVLSHMPYTHSLAAVTVWALAAGVA